VRKIALKEIAMIVRCPSETLALTWQDVDWARGRLLIHSPKKEYLEHGAGRWLPIFPELRPYLEEAFELAEPGARYVITRYREKGVNLRTQFRRIIRKAGQDPWPKLFHNLRATRQTELTAEYPIHVVCSWLGNTALIAAKHYLQVTEADFDRAAAVRPESAADCLHQSAAERLQYGVAPNRPESPESSEALTPGDSGRFGPSEGDSVLEEGMPLVGLEPTTR
jgi:hypothetical protein